MAPPPARPARPRPTLRQQLRQAVFWLALAALASYWLGHRQPVGAAEAAGGSAASGVVAPEPTAGTARDSAPAAPEVPADTAGTAPVDDAPVDDTPVGVTPVA